MAKLLLMTETHCKMKDNILDIFEDSIGVKKIIFLKKKQKKKKICNNFFK